MDQEEKTAIISEAIRVKALISFTDSANQKQMAEPYCLGIAKDTRKPTLKCYQGSVAEYSDKMENWKLYDLDTIDNVRITAIRIKDDRKGYDHNNPDMQKVLVAIT